MQKNFDGIIYKVENKQFNDMIFSFNIPLKDIKKNFIRKIKRESKQIPKNQSSIIMINSWHFGNYIIYSRELIKRTNFNNILGIIIWNKDKHERLVSDKTVLLISFRLLFNSLNLTTFLELKFFNISNDHLLPKTSQIFSIQHFSSKDLFSRFDLEFK